MRAVIFLSLFIPCFVSAAMKADFVTGTVKVKKRSSVSAAVLKTGQLLIPGDIIETGTRSLAVISSSGGKITIRANSRIQLTESEDDSGTHSALSVFAGNVNCKMNKLKRTKSGFDVNTASAVAAVRGTEFDVAALPDGSSVLSVSEGSVVLTGVEESVLVAANQESSVLLGYDPSEVRVQKRRDWNLWVEENKSAAGREKEVMAGALIKVKKLDSDISALEEVYSGKKAEADEYAKYTASAKKNGDKELQSQYFSRENDSRRAAYSAKRKAFYQAEKLMLVKNVSDGIFAWADDKKSIEAEKAEIDEIYMKHYLRYIKPIEDEEILKRSLLEKRRNKKKKQE